VVLLEEILATGQLGGSDTIVVDENYTYNFKKALTTPGIYRLNFYGLQFVNVLLDNEDIQVNVDGNTKNGFVQIAGSTDHKLLDAYQVFMGSFQRSEQMQKLNADFQQAQQQEDKEQIDILRAKYIEMETAHNVTAAEMILDMGTSLTALQVITSLDKDKHFDVYQAVAKKFNAILPDNQFVKQFVEQVDNMKLLAIGEEAPEIALPNPDGEVVKLSSLRGNYVLVDFWAKWCRPCRAENPNVVKAYNKYNKKGFEVFGVSLDRNKEDWVKAIEEDGLYWTQVSDLKFWQSEAAKTYNITGIPFALLLDKEGKIIAKNLRGQQLDDKLAELMGE
jgi:peroxiredoxin